MKKTSRIPRFFWRDLPLLENEFLLPDSIALHALRVLRLTKNDPLIFFDGSNQEFWGEIMEIQKKSARVKITKTLTISRESPFKTTLLVPVLGSEKMDYLLQKATELGVFAIQPTNCALGSVRLKEEQILARYQHWNAVLISACEQCGRNVLPKILPFLSFEKALNIAPIDSLKTIFLPQGEKHLKDFPKPSSLFLLTGAEGGFSNEEILFAQKAGFIPTRLGERILRAETAPIAALSAAQTLWGDF